MPFAPARSPTAPAARWRAAVALWSTLALLTAPWATPSAEAARRKGKPSAKNAATLTISSMTQGARVLIDDEEIGTVPLAEPVELSPGEPHIVRVEKRGFTSFVETVRLKPGEARELEADLVPSGGILQIKCNVLRAQILLDGQPIGLTPFDGDIPPGKHTVRVAATGKLAETRVIEIRPGQTIALDVTLKDVPPPRVEPDDSLLGRWWFWTAIGTAVVTGVTIGVLSSREVQVAPGAPNHTIQLP